MVFSIFCCVSMEVEVGMAVFFDSDFVFRFVRFGCFRVCVLGIFV